jgi:type III pantothenate kinase
MEDMRPTFHEGWRFCGILGRMPRKNESLYDLFTLHVGNTHTTGYCWGGQQRPLSFEWTTTEAMPSELRSILAKAGKGSADAIVAGVVPAKVSTLQKELQRMKLHSLRFRKDYDLFLRYAPSPAEKIGDDRIAGTLGALAFNDRVPWVVVDVGTAMTVNSISPPVPAKGKSPRKLPCFEGGLILPGARLSLNALAQGTAQLPEISNEQMNRWEPRPIGLNTHDAMLNGVLHAQLAAAVTLAKVQMKNLGPQAHVALTGGLCKVPAFVRAFTASFPKDKVRVVPELVHAGLMTSWLRNLLVELKNAGRS